MATKKQIQTKPTEVEVTQEAGEIRPFVFPYKAKEYPYLLSLNFQRPLTRGNVEVLFDVFPKTVIGPDGKVIVPRSHQDITKRLENQIEEVKALGVDFFIIEKNPVK